MFCSVLVKFSNICTIMFSFFIFHSYLNKNIFFFIFESLTLTAAAWVFLLWLRKYFLFQNTKKHLFFLKYFSLYIVCCPFSNKLLLLLFYCCLQFHFLTLCTLCSFNIVYVCVFVCMCSCANVLSRYLPSCLPLYDSILNLFPLTSLP